MLFQNQKFRVVLFLMFFGIVWLSLIEQSRGQQRGYIVKGLILDEESRDPLIGATILDSINRLGQTSDQNGEFTITVNKLPAILKFRHLGYFERSLTISNRKYYKEYVEGNTIVITLRQDPFIIDEVVVTDSRLAIKLFEKDPFDIIDFGVNDDRFIGFGYRNRNPLFREVFIGDHNGKILDTLQLDGAREIYQDCQGTMYVITKEKAYTIINEEDSIIVSELCDSDYFYDRVKPIKSIDENYFIYLQKSYDGQYHDYFIGKTAEEEQELLYRVGEWRNESKVRIAKNRHLAEERGKIQRSYIPIEEMRQINSRLQQYLYSVFIEYPPVNSDMIQVGDSVLLFDYNFKEILCYRTNGQLLWSARINVDLNKDFNGKIHMDKSSGRCFLEFLNVQLTYLIEIDLLSGNKIKTIPIYKYKHIDHLRIDNNRLFFLHQPDFGDRGKKIYFLDI